MVQAGIRTPAEIIATVLEDEGMDAQQAYFLSGAIANRLAKALRSVSNKDSTTIIFSEKEGEIGWGHVDHNEETKTT